MGKSCKEIVDQLKSCLKKDDCVVKGGKTPVECLRSPELSDKCKQLRQAFFFCKKEQLNMRTRIQGPKAY